MYLSKNNDTANLENRIRSAREYSIDFDAETYEEIIKCYLRRLHYTTARSYLEEMSSEGHKIPAEVDDHNCIHINHLSYLMIYISFII